MSPPKEKGRANDGSPFLSFGRDSQIARRPKPYGFMPPTSSCVSLPLRVSDHDI
jgi:hypothetical protein